MKKNLIINLTLLALIIFACGGQPTQVSRPPEPATATQQPAPVSTSTIVVIDRPAPATETTGPATKASVASVSFAKDVMPIFVNSCNECHGVKQIKEGLDMRTYESLMAGSFNGPVINGKMPKRGPKLTAGQIKIISDWIDAGALNN
jgi:hypothetical protein